MQMTSTHQSLSCLITVCRHYVSHGSRPPNGDPAGTFLAVVFTGESKQRGTHHGNKPTT